MEDGQEKSSYSRFSIIFWIYIFSDHLQNWPMDDCIVYLRACVRILALNCVYGQVPYIKYIRSNVYLTNLIDIEEFLLVSIVYIDQKLNLNCSMEKKKEQARREREIQARMFKEEQRKNVFPTNTGPFLRASEKGTRFLSA